MSEQLQLRRGTASQVAAFTGAQGEAIVDTTNNRLVVQDGATAGGFPAAKLSEVVTNARTQVSDAAYSVQTTDRMVAFIALTAARVASLPAASAFPTGMRLIVIDESGACSATNTITVTRAGSDLINGAATAVISTAYGFVAVESNGTNKWTIVDSSSAGVSTINTLSGALSIVATDGDVVSATGTTLMIGGPGGLVNKFRNGTLDLWQRGTSSLTATTSGAYTADGWIVIPTGASVTASQAGGRLLTKNSLQIAGAASVTDVIIKQRIESLIAACFCSQTVTVQAQIYNNTGGAITPALTVKHAGAQDNWSSPTTDVSAVALASCANGAWTQIAYTFSASASSYNGLEISFDFGNNFSSSSKTIQITELDIRATPSVAIGVNSNPAPPELRPIFTELAFCQRYYQQYGQIVGALNGSGTVSAVLLIPPMRAVPPISYSGTVSAVYPGVATYTSTTAPSGVNLTNGASLSFNITGFGSTASSGLVFLQGVTFSVSAEL